MLGGDLNNRELAQLASQMPGFRVVEAAKQVHVQGMKHEQLPEQPRHQPPRSQQRIAGGAKGGDTNDRGQEAVEHEMALRAQRVLWSPGRPRKQSSVCTFEQEVCGAVQFQSARDGRAS